MRIPVFPHSWQHSLNSVLSFCFNNMIAILTGGRWQLIVVLICASLMTNEDEGVFILLIGATLVKKII